ncbi:MAG: DUF1552 domain-containing protein [Minicystis sp.]
MKRERLSRRTLLRGLLGGAVVGLGLPALEIFLDHHGEALANGDAFPKRFGLWFWGNGIGPDPAKWVPTGTGTAWALSPLLAPLAPVKEHVTVVSGLKVCTPNIDPHGVGPTGILTGGRVVTDAHKAQRTLDQVIADQISSDTFNRSLEVSVDRWDTSPSYGATGKSNPPEYDPANLFNTLFGPTFHLPGEDVPANPKLGLRRSVLDAVRDDAEGLKKRLGTSDRARLDEHLENVRTLEKKIAKLETDQPVLEACKRPDPPLPAYPDIDGRPQISAVSRVMSDMLALSLACDQQRVFTFQFSHSVTDLLFPNAPAGHHQLTHDELGEQPIVQDIVRQILTEAAYFIQALAGVKEGNATLLDHCAVLFMTDCSNGKSHAVDEYPLFLAGSANGALRKGIHHRAAPGENASKLGLTLLHAFDVAAASFGSDEGYVTQTLPAIEAS